MKNVIILTLAGALLGIVAASYIVPPALSWYSEPGGTTGTGTVQALVNIPDVIRFATGRLVRGQLIGGSIGAIAGLVVGIVVAVKGRRKPVAAS